MDWFSYIVAGIMVYVAVAVFVVGMGYRIYEWLSIPKTGIKLGIFPKPSSGRARWLKLAKDSLVFPQTIEVDKKMWFFAILFHLGLLGAFIGHLRLLREWTPLVNLLGTKGMEQLGFLAGGSAGIILIIALAYYVIRRFASPYKDISVPEDYLLLGLILLIVIMGNHMRFFGHIPVADYRAYVHSLLVFKPAFTATLAASSTKWSFVLHIFFANLLFIYFPFSKLTHTIGTFAANLIRSE